MNSPPLVGNPVGKFSFGLLETGQVPGQAAVVCPAVLLPAPVDGWLQTPPMLPALESCLSLRTRESLRSQLDRNCCLGGSSTTQCVAEGSSRAVPALGAAPEGIGTADLPLAFGGLLVNASGIGPAICEPVCTADSRPPVQHAPVAAFWDSAPASSGISSSIGRPSLEAFAGSLRGDSFPCETTPVDHAGAAAKGVGKPLQLWGIGIS